MYRRTLDGQVLDFGTTGLLRFSNLVMYDRQTESWWNEFSGEAIVGDLTGKKLELLPLSIVSWKDFKATFPQGKVLSRDTGVRRPYGANPYTSYDSASSPFLYGGPEDRRLPALERIVGIDIGTDSLTIPFLVLEKEPIVHSTLAGQDLVVFFKKGTASTLDARDISDGRDVGSVGVFAPQLEGKKLTFRLDGGRIVDEQTSSTWNLLGKAESGPLAGKSLRPLAHQAGPFWFTRAVFKPDTVIYRGR